MIGLIGSSIVSGLIVSRTGRYKWLIVGSVAVMGFAVFLMTNLTKDTPVPMVWLWMFIAGLGVGPTFSVPDDRHPERRAVPASSASRPRTSRSSARSAARSPSRSSGRSSGRRSRTSSCRRWPPRACRQPVHRRASAQASASGNFDCQLADRRRRHGRGDPRCGARAVPGAHRAGDRADGRGHPRGIQPRDRPDVLARRVRRDRLRSSRPSRSRRSRCGPPTSSRSTARLRPARRRPPLRRSRVHLGRVAHPSRHRRPTDPPLLNEPARSPTAAGPFHVPRVAGIPSAA